MQTLSRGWLLRVQEATWLVCAVAVPLALNPWGANAFELPKTALLLALVLLLALMALLRAIVGPGSRAAVRRPPPPLLRPALALAAALALASALSVDRRVSLWGSFERQQGLLTLGAYIGLFLLTAANLHTTAQAERLWRALAWGSAPLVVYGLVQGCGIDPLGWRSDAASPVLSTIGRANFFGSYLVVVIPLTAGRLLAAPRGHRWPLALLLAGQLACLALTQARGAWIGLGAAAATGLVAWGIATRDRRPALAAPALVILAAGSVALLNLPQGPLAPLAHLPGLERLAAISRTDEGSAAARLTIWRATLPLVAARPWLGYGPETMRPVFAAVFPPQLVYYQGRDVVVDRAHNLWLDLAMSAGSAGAAAFGALLLGFGKLARQGLRRGRAPGEPILWTALVGSVAGHVIDLQFGFDLTASATVFWLVLALGAARARADLSPDRDTHVRPEGGRAELLPLLPPTLVTLALIALLCVRPLLADIAFWRAHRDEPRFAEQLERSARAVHLWPLEPEYRLGLAWYLGQTGDVAAAQAQLDAAHRLSPGDPRTWAMQGEMATGWAEADPSHLAAAEAAYRRALALAPNTASHHAALGVILARQGRREEAIAALERAVALDATYGEAFQALAELYRAAGREDRATWAEEEAMRWSAQD